MTSIINGLSQMFSAARPDKVSAVKTQSHQPSQAESATIKFNRNIVANDTARAEWDAHSASAQTRTNAQIIGQSENNAYSVPEPSVAVSDFLEFMDTANKGAGGFYAAQMLASKGMTEEEFEALSPEEKEKFLKEIEEEIKKASENRQRALENGVPAGIEQYAIPKWMAEYGTDVTSNIIDNPTLSDGLSKSERAEYQNLAWAHYREVLNENNIDTTAEHHAALIADKHRSDELRTAFESKLSTDKRFQELRDKIRA